MGADDGDYFRGGSAIVRRRFSDRSRSVQLPFEWTRVLGEPTLSYAT